MTKSIKEKERLKQIKNHVSLGSRITADSLKVRMVYSRYNHHREKQEPRPSLIKSEIDSTFKKYMPELLLPLAKIIGIFEFKIKISMYSYYDDIDDQHTSLFILVTDKLDAEIAHIVFNSNQLHNIFDSTEVLDSNHIKQSLQAINIKHLKALAKTFVTKIDKAEFVLYSAYKHTNKEILKLRADFAKHQKLYLKIKKVLKTPVLDIVFNGSINYHIKKRLLGTRDKKLIRILKPASLYNDIEYIKYLIDNKLLILDIDNELLVMENIDYISDIIKMTHY